MGSIGGELSHKLTIGELPEHGHFLNGWAYAVPHNEKESVFALCKPWDIYNNYRDTTAMTGGNEYHNNLPPYKAVMVWIRIS